MATISRLRTVWTGVAGAPYYTNLYFDGVTDSASAAAALDGWGDFIDTFKSNFVAGMIANIEGDLLQYDDTSGTLTGSVATTGRSITCTGGGTLLPRQAQLLVQWRTGIVVAGRRLRGRTFLPGQQETLNDAGGVPSSALVSSMQAGLQGFIDLPAPPHMVVWSRTHGVSSNALQATVWNQWANLRSRRD